MFIFLLCYAHAQRLDMFCSGSDTANNAKTKKHIPYTDVVSYFGYIDSSWVAADTIAGIKMYYLYFFLPRNANKVGLRMISPVPDYVFPNKGDVVAEEYFNFIKTNKDYFDPWIMLEHQVEMKYQDNSDTTKRIKEWIALGENNDAEELIAQPSGKKTNALLRVVSDTTQLYKTLDAGVCRVGFSSLKDTLISGSFILQIGASVILPKMKITMTEAELPEQ